MSIKIKAKNNSCESYNGFHLGHITIFDIIINYETLPEVFNRNSYIKLKDICENDIKFFSNNKEIYNLEIKSILYDKCLDSKSKVKKHFPDSSFSPYSLYGLYFINQSNETIPKITHVEISNEIYEKSLKFKEFLKNIDEKTTFSKLDLLGIPINLNDLVIIKSRKSILGKIIGTNKTFWSVKTSEGQYNVLAENLIVIPKTKEHYDKLYTKITLDILKN